MAEYQEHVEVQMPMSAKARVVAGKAKTVFVVYGRNLKAKDAMMNYLTALGVDAKELKTIPYEEGSPRVEDLLEKAFNIAKGIVVLLTPDDRSCLREDWASLRDKAKRFHRPMYQPRMNVIFEIGWAYGKEYQDKLILVEMNEPIEEEELRMPSDISSDRIMVVMSDSGSIREGMAEIKRRLENAKVLGQDLREIPREERTEFEDEFLRAIQGVKEPAGITGLDQERWVARTVSGVRQGVDFRRVELGGPFRRLQIAVTSNSPYWRAGIKLEESDSLTTVPDLVHEKSLLFHVGHQDESYGVYGYYDSSWADLQAEKKRQFANEILDKVHRTPIHIELAVRQEGNENLLFCEVIEEGVAWQPEPPVRIPDKLDLLSNVYLVAWGDAENEEVLRDYTVEFSGLEYDLWKE